VADAICFRVSHRKLPLAIVGLEVPLLVRPGCVLPAGVEPGFVVSAEPVETVPSMEPVHTGHQINFRAIRANAPPSPEKGHKEGNILLNGATDFILFAAEDSIGHFWLQIYFGPALCCFSHSSKSRIGEVPHAGDGWLFTMGCCKALIGPRLRARGFAARQTETAVGVVVLNQMLVAGRPDSVRRTRVIA
jgi:hypothetical protein